MPDLYLDVNCQAGPKLGVSYEYITTSYTTSGFAHSLFSYKCDGIDGVYY